jgi:murein DD-endopeptidase MepM/ murein hydrolase activator NlpD
VKTEALAPQTPPAVDPHRDAKTAAKQLEAFFLRRLLAESRPQGGGMLDGGFAGDTFKQMLDEAVADKVSAAGGLGMADMFVKQLTGKDAGVPPSVLPQPGIPHDLGPELPGAPRFQLPVAGRASSGYGLRHDPIKGDMINHPGFDLAAPAGSPVAAAAGGTIVHAGPAGTYGNLVTVRHDNGFETRYAHLSAVTVAKGDRVEAGQLVGKVGSTGYSTGPHLHFEIRHDGKPVDPAPLLPLNSSPARTNR